MGPTWFRSAPDGPMLAPWTLLSGASREHTHYSTWSRSVYSQPCPRKPLLPAKIGWTTVYPKKYAHGFVVLCFVVVMQSFIMNSHEVFIHIHQGCFAGTGAIVRLPQCQWSKPDGYGKISQCITTTKHSKAKTGWIFLGIYCTTSFRIWIVSYTHIFRCALSHQYDNLNCGLFDDSRSYGMTSE